MLFGMVCLVFRRAAIVLFVGKQFPRSKYQWSESSYADKDEDAICWAYVCPVCSEDFLLERLS